MGKENIIQTLNRWSLDIAMLTIAIIAMVSIGYAANHNGKIEICSDLGMYYTINGECLPCEETGRIFIDGECIIPKQSTDYIDRMLKGDKNGTIL